MLIKLIAIGNKMPAWVNHGVDDYVKRTPKGWKLELVEIPPVKRGKNADTARVLSEEGERLMAAASDCEQVIALDRLGKSISSLDLAAQCETWYHQNATVAWLIGGAEGLSPACLSQATHRWSLSSLTLPHPMVRLVVAEQVYRAYSIFQNHPYHR